MGPVFTLLTDELREIRYLDKVRFSVVLLSVLFVGVVCSEELPVLQVGHSFSPHRLAYSSDGRLFASQSRVGDVKIWNRESLSLLNAFSSPSGLARGVEFSKSGRYVAASIYGGAYLCDRFQDRVIRRIDSEFHTFGPRDDECIVTTAKGVERRSLPDFELLATWSPEEGKSLIRARFLKGSRLVAELAPSGFVELDPVNLTLIGQFPDIAVPNPRYSITPIPNRMGFLVHRLGHIEVLDLSLARPALRKVHEGMSLGEPAVSPDGKWIAIGVVGGLEIREVDTGNLVHKFNLKVSVSAFSWSPDGSELAVATDNDGVLLVDSESGGKVSELLPETLFDVSTHDLPCSSSPDGSLLALAGDDGLMRVVEIGHKVAVRVVGIPDGSPNLVHAFDANRILSRSKRGGYRLWDARTLKSEPLPLQKKIWQSGKNGSGLWFRTDAELLGLELIEGKPSLVSKGPIPKMGPIAVTQDFQFVFKQNDGDELSWIAVPRTDGNKEDPISISNARDLNPPLIHRRESGVLYGVDLHLGLVKATLKEASWRKVNLGPAAHSYMASAFSVDTRLWAMRSFRDLPELEIVDLEKELVLSRLEGWTPDEVSSYLEVLSFANHGQSLWACGPEGRPILFRTADGKALLRLTTWPDGSWVMETPEGDLDGSPDGLDRVRWLNEAREDAQVDVEKLKKHHRPDKIRKILDSALGGS
jgi:WD40 repeat protein